MPNDLFTQRQKLLKERLKSYGFDPEADDPFAQAISYGSPVSVANIDEVKRYMNVNDPALRAQRNANPMKVGDILQGAPEIDFRSADPFKDFLSKIGKGDIRTARREEAKIRDIMELRDVHDKLKKGEDVDQQTLFKTLGADAVEFDNLGTGSFTEMLVANPEMSDKELQEKLQEREGLLSSLQGYAQKAEFSDDPVERERSQWLANEAKKALEKSGLGAQAAQAYARGTGQMQGGNITGTASKQFAAEERRKADLRAAGIAEGTMTGEEGSAEAVKRAEAQVLRGRTPQQVAEYQRAYGGRDTQGAPTYHRGSVEYGKGAPTGFGAGMQQENGAYSPSGATTPQTGTTQPTDTTTQPTPTVSPNFALDVQTTKSEVMQAKEIAKQNPNIYGAYAAKYEAYQSQIEQVEKNAQRQIDELTTREEFLETAMSEIDRIAERQKVEDGYAKELRDIRLQIAESNKDFAEMVQEDIRVSQNLAISEKRREMVQEEMRLRNENARLGIGSDSNGLKRISNALQQGEDKIRQIRRLGDRELMKSAFKIAADYKNETDVALYNYEKELSRIEGDTDDKIASVKSELNKSVKDREDRIVQIMNTRDEKMAEADINAADVLVKAKEKLDERMAKEEGQRMATQKQAMSDLMLAAKTWGDKTPEGYKKYLRDALPNIDVDSVLSVPTATQSAKAEKTQADDLVSGLFQKNVAGQDLPLGVYAARALGRRTTRQRIDEAPIMHDLIDMGNADTIKEQIIITAQNSFSKPTQREIDSIDEALWDIGFIEERLKQFDDKYGGIYKSTLEKGKAFLKNRDEAWIALKQDIGSQMAETRKKFAGVAVTDTELSFLNQFLVDFKFDTTRDMKIKLEGAKENLTISKQAKFDGILGQGAYKSLTGEGYDMSHPNAPLEKFDDDYMRTRLKGGTSSNQSSSTGSELSSLGYITQDFDTPVASKASGGLYEPSTVRAWGGIHAGIDIAIPQGTEFASIIDGRVIDVGEKDGWGNTIVIKDANGAEHRISHMSGIDVTVGQSIRKGQIIGKTGGAVGTQGAGLSTGAHIDYRIRKNGKYVNPFRYNPYA